MLSLKRRTKRAMWFHVKSHLSALVFVDAERAKLATRSKCSNSGGHSKHQLKPFLKATAAASLPSLLIQTSEINPELIVSVEVDSLS